MDSQTVVTAKLKSGARVHVDTARDGWASLDLLSVKHVSVRAEGVTDPCIVIRGASLVGDTPDLTVTDVTVLLSLGHAAAIGAAAVAAMERLAHPAPEPQAETAEATL
jgi:hypothetical protein